MSSTRSVAIQDVAAFSTLGTVSFAVGRYHADNSPAVELEVGLTYDKGFFKAFDGKPHEEFFLSIALRTGPFTLELWNDSWHPAHLGTIDFGPTYGLLFQYDILRTQKP